jgi:hypothetical protein
MDIHCVGILKFDNMYNTKQQEQTQLSGTVAFVVPNRDRSDAEQIYRTCAGVSPMPIVHQSKERGGIIERHVQRRKDQECI